MNINFLLTIYKNQNQTPLAYSSLTHGIFYEKTCCINRILRSSEISVGKERVRTSADRYRGLPDRFRIRPSEACWLILGWRPGH